MLSDAVITAFITTAGIAVTALAAALPAYFAYLGIKAANAKLETVTDNQATLHKLVDGQTEKLVRVEKLVSLKEGQAEGNEKLLAAKEEIARLGGIADKKEGV